MFQISQGQTSPNDWKDYSSLGIYVDVDTSACGFTQTPHYLVTIEGSSHHWCVNGVNAIYQPSPTGFRVYLRWTDDDGHYGNYNPLRASFAKGKNWYLRWTAIQSCPCPGSRVLSEESSSDSAE